MEIRGKDERENLEHDQIGTADHTRDRMGKLRRELVIVSNCIISTPTQSSRFNANSNFSFLKRVKAMWVPTMIVTFRYVPVKFQVLVVNVVGVAWNTFLAYAVNNAHGSSSENETAAGGEGEEKTQDIED